MKINHCSNHPEAADAPTAQHTKQNPIASEIIIIHRQTRTNVVKSPQDSLWK